jgi:fructose-specific phosphotransferase system IIC component
MAKIFVVIRKLTLKSILLSFISLMTYPFYSLLLYPLLMVFLSTKPCIDLTAPLHLGLKTVSKDTDVNSMGTSAHTS